MNAPQKIRVMVVDDSLSIRLMLQKIINATPDLEVAATASNADEARAKLTAANPDVMTLDVEMPGMDGLMFLEKLMALRPMPVVMVSTLTHKGTAAALRALEIGAVDVVGKPSASAQDITQSAAEITDKIRAAAHARIGNRRNLPVKPMNAQALGVKPSLTTDAVLPLKSTPTDKRPSLIAIGASTGGTEAIRVVLQHLPNTLPGIVIAQHMSAGFTKPFAERLKNLTKLNVMEARDNQPIETGCAYIAPAGLHLAVRYKNNGYVCSVMDGEAVNRHKPSVDVLFRSCVNEAGANVHAAILTGMGDDGARSLLELKNAGAFTLAQNEASCVVYGMPKAAAELGAACAVGDLETIATKLQTGGN